MKTEVFPKAFGIEQRSETILYCKQQQSLINCTHNEKRARNVHAKRFLRAQNDMHVNQSKHL